MPTNCCASSRMASLASKSVSGSPRCCSGVMGSVTVLPISRTYCRTCAFSAPPLTGARPSAFRLGPECAVGAQTKGIHKTGNEKNEQAHVFLPPLLPPAPHSPTPTRTHAACISVAHANGSAVPWFKQRWGGSRTHCQSTHRIDRRLVPSQSAAPGGPKQGFVLIGEGKKAKNLI